METLSEQTCYDILEVQPGFTRDQIYTSYLNAKKLYDSKNQDVLSTFTPQELKELDELLDEAYEVLSYKMRNTECDESFSKNKKPAIKAESKGNDLEKPSQSTSPTTNENTKEEILDKDEQLTFNNDELNETETTFFNFPFQEEGDEESISHLDTHLTIEKEICLENQEEDFKSIVENHYTLKEESPQSVFDKLESNNTNEKENLIESQQYLNTSKVEILDGPFLKKIRESRQIDIESISSSSKVSVNYLRAIEENAFVRLPAPVFIRGFVISYAKALGLDAKKIANSYMTLYKQAKQISGEKTI